MTQMKMTNNFIGNVVSHPIAKDEFEVVLKYIKQQSKATLLDVMWVKTWQNASAKSYFLPLQQKPSVTFYN